MSNPTLFLYTGNGSLAFQDRAGGGTLTGSGAVRYAPASGARTNWAVNPSFETGTTGYSASNATLSRSSEQALYGSYSLKIVVSADGAASAFTSSRPTPFSGSYTYSWYVYNASSGSRTFQARVNGINGNSVVVAPGVWTRVSYAATISATDNYHVGRCTDALAGDVFYVDGVQIESGSSATNYVDGSTGGVWLDPITGVLGTAHASPSVSQAVAWVEEGTTNRILNPWASSDVSNITAIGSTRTRVTTYAYIGSASVQVVTNNSVSGEGIYFTSGTGLSLTGARTLIPSIYVRGGGTLRVNVQILYTDLTSDSSTWAGSAAFGTMTDAWTRLVGDSIAANAAKTINEVRLYIVTKDTAQAATFYVANAQIEDKAYATSYCDGSLGTGYAWSGTAHASSSTRTATALSIATTGRISNLIGSTVVRAAPDYIATGGFPSFLTAGVTGLGTDALIFYFPSTTNRATLERRNNNVNTSAVDLTPTMAADTWSMAYAYWNGTLQGVALDNSGAVEATHTTAPTGNWGATGISIGSNSAGGVSINGLIGPVLIADRPLTARERATLNARTSWGWSTLKGRSILLPGP